MIGLNAFGVFWRSGAVAGTVPGPSPTPRSIHGHASTNGETDDVTHHTWLWVVTTDRTA